MCLAVGDVLNSKGYVFMPRIVFPIVIDKCENNFMIN